MDHAGAVVGPLLAFGLLAAQADLEHVFLASAIPGALVIALLVFGLPPVAPAAPATAQRFSWRALHGRLRAIILTAGLLAVASVPEVFVVLWATQAGMAVTWVPLVWAAASLVKMLIAMPAGIFPTGSGACRCCSVLVGEGDRVVAAGVCQPGAVGVWALFVAYAATLAMTEPAERALIGDHATAGERGTAFGLYHLTSGVLVLPGAVIFGSLWQALGSATAFAAAAAITALAAALMLALASPSRRAAP